MRKSELSKWRRYLGLLILTCRPEKIALTTTGSKILASCDAPEDDWDNENDACVEADESVKLREMKKTRLEVQVSKLT
jgi:hypothetical protein